MLRPCSWAPFWVEWYSWISSSWLNWQLRAGLADCDGARRAAGDFDSWSIRSGLDCASQGMVAQYSRPSPDSTGRETSSVTAVIVHYVGSRWSKSLALWNLSATVSCFARPSLLGHGINRHWCSRTILPGPWGLCSWHEWSWFLALYCHARQHRELASPWSWLTSSDASWEVIGASVWPRRPQWWLYFQTVSVSDACIPIADSQVDSGRFLCVSLQ